MHPALARTLDAETLRDAVTEGQPARLPDDCRLDQAAFPHGEAGNRTRGDERQPYGHGLRRLSALQTGCEADGDLTSKFTEIRTGGDAPGAVRLLHLAVHAARDHLMMTEAGE